MRIGQIVGAFGIKGQVKVQPLTEFLDRFTHGTRVRVNENWAEIDSLSSHKGHLIIKFSGVADRTQAEQLQWTYVEAPDVERPPLEEGEYLTRDLIGLQAFTPEGEPLGKVDDVVAIPAHDVLVIGELLVPAVDIFVKQVDLEGRRIVLELIPGMRGEDEWPLS